MVRACPVCGSRRWRRDNVTGSAVCEDGHVYQDFRVENQDADGPSQHAMQRRKMKTGKRGPNKKELGGKNEAYYEGDDAEYLRVQALQILLRTQVQALRKLWDLPEVYEMIVRDLWTYQLSISALPTPPEDPHPRSRSNTPLPQPHASTASQGLLGRLEADDKSDSGSSADDAESDKSDKEDDPEVDLDLLEEMSRLSELSDKEEGQGEGSRGRGKRKGRQGRRLKVSDTLVVLVMALWMLRRGTMSVDIENLVNANVIPYLDFAHSMLLPAEMREHMNRAVMRSLSPIRCPSPKYLFASLRLFARTLNTDFGLPIPDVNLPLISWRAISALGGTPVTYSQVTRLLDLVDINTSLLETSITVHKRRARSTRGSRRNSTRGPSRATSRGRSAVQQAAAADGSDDDLGAEVATALVRRTDRNRDVIMPELAVVAAWVVVMKMAYGLDGIERRHGDGSDPIGGMPDGRAWVGELERRLRDGALNPPKKDLAKHDFSALPMEIDRYLNLAEEVLLKDREAPAGSDILTFPLLPASTVPPLLPPPASYRHFHTALPLTPSVPPVLIPGTGIPPEPGEEIRSYDPKDTTGTLPRSYEAIIQSAAAVVGVQVKDVAEVVQLIERRLENVRKERKISMRARYGNGRPKDRSKSRAKNGVEQEDGEFEDDIVSSGESGSEEL